MYTFLRQYLPKNISTVGTALFYAALILLIIYVLVMRGPAEDLRYLNY